MQFALACAGPANAQGLDFQKQLLELGNHVKWAIAHEGCPVYSKAGPKGEQTILPAKDLRDCLTSVQSHNPAAKSLINKTPDPLLQSVTKEAVDTAKSELKVREHFEWVLTQQEQLSGFKSLASEPGGFATIRSKYRVLQSHNPDAKNALNVLSDAEIKKIIDEPRLAVGAKELDRNALRTIAAYTQPTTVTLTRETSLRDLSRRVYGTEAQAYIETIAASNPSMSPGESIKPGTSVVVPAVPTPNRARQLPLKPGMDAETVARQVSATTSTISEVARRGHLGIPVKAALQSTTIATFGDNGARWHAASIGVDQLRADDIALNADTVIGVVDAGAELKHPALVPIFWKLPQEFGKENWPGGSFGYDFSNNDADPAEEVENSHGTHVTGIATARQLAVWYPALDKARVADSIKAFSLKVAGPDGSLEFVNVENAIQAGIDNGVAIFNLSLFGPFSRLLRKYLTEDERQNNTLLLVAAGQKTDWTPQFDLDATPAMHPTFRSDAGAPLRNVIFVAALSDTGKTLADWSNYGRKVVHIAAPGLEVWSSIRPGTFGPLSGTSQAAPFVALTAAILRAQKAGMNVLAIKNRILNTCDFVPELMEWVNSGCRLNLLKAVIRNSDLIEMRTSGALIRGAIQCTSVDCASGQDPTARIWLEDGAKAIVVRASGRRDEVSMVGKQVSVRLPAGENCPGALAEGLCRIPVGEIRDLVFRLP